MSKLPCEEFGDDREPEARELFVGAFLAQCRVPGDEDRQAAWDAFDRWWRTGVAGGVAVSPEAPKPWCGTPRLVSLLDPLDGTGG